MGLLESIGRLLACKGELREFIRGSVFVIVAAMEKQTRPMELMTAVEKRIVIPQTKLLWIIGM
jgi:hypothetical protein